MPAISVGALDSDAASFKGGRDYVHASDIVPFLDAFGRDQLDGALLERVEFHAPLKRQGLIVVTDRSEPFEKAEAAASGRYLHPRLGETGFLVCASPFVVVDTGRGFDEATLADTAVVEAGGAALSIGNDGRHSLMEHVSAGMKRLCRAIAPGCTRWWFVRLVKTAPLPDRFRQIGLGRKRVTLGRIVTAGIEIDGTPFGQIEFVGVAE